MPKTSHTPPTDGQPVNGRTIQNPDPKTGRAPESPSIMTRGRISSAVDAYRPAIMRGGRAVSSPTRRSPFGGAPRQRGALTPSRRQSPKVVLSGATGDRSAVSVNDRILGVSR